MFSLGLPLLFGAPPAAGADAGPAAGIMTFVPFILIIAIFYFLIIRPQNKKQKETQKMLETLKKGDKVVTIGGIHGTISSTHDKSVVLKVDDDTKIEFSRNAIATVISVSKTDGTEEPESEAKDNLLSSK